MDDGASTTAGGFCCRGLPLHVSSLVLCPSPLHALLLLVMRRAGKIFALRRLAVAARTGAPERSERQTAEAEGRRSMVVGGGEGGERATSAASRMHGGLPANPETERLFEFADHRVRAHVGLSGGASRTPRPSSSGPRLPVVCVSPPLMSSSVAASSALVREVLSGCRLGDPERRGYLTPREIKYVFVACVGYKPTKVRKEQASGLEARRG
jgi:hypothetical protein